MTFPSTEVQFVLEACILDVNQRVNDPFRYISWEIFVTGFKFGFQF